MSENYLGIMTENYERELSSENYDLVYTQKSLDLQGYWRIQKHFENM